MNVNSVAWWWTRSGTPKYVLAIFLQQRGIMIENDFSLHGKLDYAISRNEIPSCQTLSVWEKGGRGSGFGRTISGEWSIRKGKWPITVSRAFVSFFFTRSIWSPFTSKYIGNARWKIIKTLRGDGTRRDATVRWWADLLAPRRRRVSSESKSESETVHAI